MMMTSLVQAYPQFVADQVLTQDQLNDMRIFLDSQNRATRVKLVGIGIVCGLHARIGDIDIKDKDENVIDTVQGVIVSEGYGVTSDGWLICIPEKKYIHIQDYTDPDFEYINGNDEVIYRPWRQSFPLDNSNNGTDNSQIPIQRLLENVDVINGSSLLNTDGANATNDLVGKALLLYLEINTTELKSCFTTDCNNKGQSIELEVEALLVDKDSRFFPGATKCNELAPIQQVPRWSTALQITAGIEVPQIDAPGQIKAAYQHVSGFLNQELNAKINDFYDANEAFFCLSEFDAKYDTVTGKLGELANDPNLGQYNYDILKDIAQAYNECVEQACKILKVCCNEEYFPRHLMLRDFEGISLAKTTGWRTPFYPSAVDNVMHQDLEKVRLLFVRLLDLVNGFFTLPPPAAADVTSANLPNDKIKITPSHSEVFPLAERAIPFYFNSDVENTWQLDACCNTPSLGYHWNKHGNALATTYNAYRKYPLHYNINTASFLRIEGHVNSDSSVAKTNIETLRKRHHLDFQIMKLPLRATSPLTLPPDNILTLYREVGEIWKEFIKEIEAGNLTDQQTYQSVMQEIRNRQAEIETANNEWCQSQVKAKLSCDFSHLQADYNILRAELLCLLHKCKPAFNDLPDIEFEEGGGQLGGSVCTEFFSLPKGGFYGNQAKNEPGQEVFAHNNIKVTVHEFNQGGTSPLTFGNGNVEEVNHLDGRFIFISNLNFRFNVSASQIGFTTNSVEFVYRDFGGDNNIGINDSTPANLKFSDFTGSASPIPSMPGYTLEVVEIANGNFENKLKGIIRGTGSQSIQSVTLGGQEFALFEVCAFGESTEEEGAPIDLPTYTFDSRFDRIKLICDLLVKTMHHDIRCFNFPLFRQLIKDFAGTSIQVKLWLHCVFKSVGGRFLPYKYYPEWNDFEDCLDHIHGNCLYPRFAALATIFEYTIAGSLETFGSFSKKHPGAEHMAGVPKGGTFLLVYENETNKNVIADFALSHFVDDCCACKVDMNNIKFPSVALTDYRIVEIPEQGATVELEIPVLENDFNLHGTTRPKLIHPEGGQESDKGADLDFNVDDGIITYKWENAQVGIDHFTYAIHNGHSQDIGHVYIGICLEGRKPEEKPNGPDTGLGFDGRIGIYKAGLEELKNSFEAGHKGYTLSEKFVLETVSDTEMSITKVSNAYRKTTDELLESTPDISRRGEAFVELLAIVNNAYMDRVVVHNPEVPNNTAMKNLQAIKKAMEEENISTNKVIEDWNPSQLKGVVGDKTATIEAIENIFQRGS